MNMGRLLVSVRGISETIEAVKGGAHIADVEYPGSALGTPYPLNIDAVRNGLDKEGYDKIPISTNIGENQLVKSTACQAALGVAVAGADYIKCGFAGYNLKAAIYLGRNLVRTIKKWTPEKKVYPAVFPEEEFNVSFNPLIDGLKLLENVECHGLLIDTYNKGIGKSLLDYYSINQIKQFVDDIHSIGKEAWLAGSISKHQLLKLWDTGVDVICVRGAACEILEGDQRFGKVKSEIVAELLSTLKK